MTRLEPLWATGGHVNPAVLRTFVQEPPISNRVVSTVVDGRAVIVGCAGSHQTMCTIDIDTGQEVGRMEGPFARAVIACTTVDGAPVAVIGSLDGTVSVWDLRTHRLVHSLGRVHRDSVSRIVCTTLDGEPIAVSLGTGGAYSVRSLRTAEPIVVGLALAPMAFQTFACAVDGGQTTVLQCHRGELVLSDLATGVRLASHHHHHGLGEVRHISAVTLRDKQMFMIIDERGAMVCDPTDGLSVKRVSTTVHAIAAATGVMGEQAVVVIVSYEGGVTVLDALKGKSLGAYVTVPVNLASVVSLLPHNGRILVVVSGREGRIYVLDSANTPDIGQPQRDPGRTIEFLRCHRFGNAMAVLTGDGHTTHGWDIESGDQQMSRGSVDLMHDAAFSVIKVDGRDLAVMGKRHSHAVQVRDMHSWLRRAELHGHSALVKALTCTTIGGRPVAISSAGEQNIVWDLRTMQPVYSFPQGGPPSRILTFPMADETIAVMVGDPISLWRLSNQGAIPMPKKHYVIGGLGGLPVGDRLLLVYGVYNVIKIVDAETEESAGPELSGHTGPIAAIDCVAFRGRSLAVTGDYDATLRVWDMVTGECLDVWPIWGPVTAISCSEEGHVAMAAGVNSDLAVFRLVGE